MQVNSNGPSFGNDKNVRSEKITKADLMHIVKNSDLRNLSDRDLLLLSNEITLVDAKENEKKNSIQKTLVTSLIAIATMAATIATIPLKGNKNPLKLSEKLFSFSNNLLFWGITGASWAAMSYVDSKIEETKNKKKLENGEKVEKTNPWAQAGKAILFMLGSTLVGILSAAGAKKAGKFINSKTIKNSKGCFERLGEKLDNSKLNEHLMTINTKTAKWAENNKTLSSLIGNGIDLAAIVGCFIAPSMVSLAQQNKIMEQRDKTFDELKNQQAIQYMG